MSRKMSFVILALIVIGGAITGCGPEATAEVVEIEVFEPTVESRKEEAAKVGEWVVTRNDSGYAGRVGIFVGLDMQEVTVRSGKHYRMAVKLNLFIRSRHAGSDDWLTVQEIYGNPGDYIIINTDADGVSSVQIR